MNAHVTKIIRDLFINKSEKELHTALKSFPLDSDCVNMECLHGAGDL